MYQSKIGSGDPIYEDRDMILLKDNLAKHETCAHLVTIILLCVCVVTVTHYINMWLPFRLLQNFNTECLCYKLDLLK